MTLPLSIRALSKRYGARKVLDGVSLDMREGEIYGLIGLNGAGKTTMIKILLGLARAQSGEARVFGHAPESMAARKTYAYLPEKFLPSPMLRGEEFIRFTLEYYGLRASKRDLASAAKMLELDAGALTRRAGAYSKGMGQKLGLLATLLARRALLILDEPMSGLDPQARLLLKTQLLRARSEGRAVFFSSHILADMDEICDRVGILHEGALRFTGTPAELRASHGGGTLEAAFLSVIGHGQAAA